MSKPRTLEDIISIIRLLAEQSKEMKIVFSNPMSNIAQKKIEVHTQPLSSSKRYAYHYIQESQSFTQPITKEELVDFFNARVILFKQVLIQTATHSHQILQNNKGKTTIISKQQEHKNLVESQEKQYLISAKEPWLYSLGITTKEGKVKDKKQAKFRQINKFVEIVSTTLREEDKTSQLTLTDLGCGKGYLSFALYSYLKARKSEPKAFHCIDIKQDIMNNCNQIAMSLDYKNLHFTCGDIGQTSIKHTDVLIALHACDILTDIALYKAVKAGAKYIFSSPCCHKQIRKLMRKTKETPFIHKQGILQERQAEIVTDTIRGLLLEQHGYTVDIFEFVSTEHTSKNLMIRAVQTGKKRDNRTEIETLKRQYGIQGAHYLEDLFKS